MTYGSEVCLQATQTKTFHKMQPKYRSDNIRNHHALKQIRIHATKRRFSYDSVVKTDTVQKHTRSSIADSHQIIINHTSRIKKCAVALNNGTVAPSVKASHGRYKGWGSTNFGGNVIKQSSRKIDTNS
uniref:Uncharacterized protein n=1 Tax=Aegilops tauschii subsp. strangulata TaxID=200361 RepID=A0A452YZC6_AEGTS